MWDMAPTSLTEAMTVASPMIGMGAPNISVSTVRPSWAWNEPVRTIAPRVSVDRMKVDMRMRRCACALSAMAAHTLPAPDAASCVRSSRCPAACLGV